MATKCDSRSCANPSTHALHRRRLLRHRLHRRLSERNPRRGLRFGERTRGTDEARIRILSSAAENDHAVLGLRVQLHDTGKGMTLKSTTITNATTNRPPLSETDLGPGEILATVYGPKSR